MHAMTAVTAACNGKGNKRNKENKGNKGNNGKTSARSLVTPLHATQGEGDEEEAKRRRQSARGYQKKFSSSHGDAITALNVLCAFEQSPSPESFCRSAAQQ